MPKTYSAEQKAEYKRIKRAEAKAKLGEALDELQSDEGVKRWLRMRAAFRTYSWHNTMLIALQTREWPEAPTMVGGAKSLWAKVKRHPKQGTTSLRIFAPILITKRDSNGKDVLDDKGKPIKFVLDYKLVPVFDLSQTEGEDLPEKPVIPRLEGEEGRMLLVDVYTYAEKHGVTIKFDDDQSMDENLRIVMTQVVGQQVSLMAMDEKESVIEYLSQDERDIISEAVTFIVLSEMGFDTSSESVPKIWETAVNTLLQEDVKLNGLTEVQKVVDRLAYYIDRETRVLEAALVDGER